jgi:hypothetical protein
MEVTEGQDGRIALKKVNWSGLISMVSTMTLNVALVGFVVAGNNQIG